jgi:hypothetical protein
MSAYSILYLVGAALMVALLGWISISAFRRGTSSGRLIGAVALLLLVGSAALSARWFKPAHQLELAEPRFAERCLQNCRRQLKDPGALCEAECRCFAEKLGKYSEGELASWLTVGKGEGAAAVERRAAIEAAIPVCGRDVISRSFEELCDEDCAKEGSCPAGFCRCMRDQLVAHPQFSEYAWLSKVVLSEVETPEAEAWQRQAAARCIPPSK